MAEAVAIFLSGVVTASSGQVLMKKGALRDRTGVYDRNGLMSVLASAGFEVPECQYFFTALVPGLLVRSLLSRNGTWGTVESGCGLKMSKLGNAVLGLASGPGDALLSPCGT